MVHSDDYLIDVGNINGFITTAMVKHIGPGASQSNYLPIIVKLFESTLYPFTDYPTAGLYEDLTQYGIGPNESHEILTVAQVIVSKLLGNIIGNKLGIQEYDVFPQEGTSLLIRERKHLTMKFIENTPVSKFLEEWSSFIKESQDNGDWVPPKMRIN